MSAIDPVVVSTLVEVDPQIAFEVFSEEIDAWWKQGPRFRVDPGRKSSMRLEPGVGGRLLEVYPDPGVEPFELGRVLEWQPPRLLVVSLGGRDFDRADRTRVQILFEPEGESTRVTVEQRGWDRLPEDHAAFHGQKGEAFQAMMGLWWAELLTEHRAFAVQK